MTTAEAIALVQAMEKMPTNRKDIQLRITRCRRSISDYKFVPIREIELLQSILFVEGIDNSTENTETTDV